MVTIASKQILLLLLMASICTATFSGSIAMSTSQIQSTSVIYTFTLNFQNNIPAGGKLVVRFPSQFTSVFTTTCVAMSGFTSTLSCTYTSTTRMLILTGAWPNTMKQIKFTVTGVTNPMYVGTSDIFNCQSFQMISGQWQLIETSGNSIKITTTPGAITLESLVLANPTVGISSVMTTGFMITHSIPKNGLIILTTPKWNGLDPDPSAWISLIATSTSPGNVLCQPSVFVYQNFTSCIFTQGTTSDQLVINLNEVNDVPPGAQIQFKVAGVLGPPSQQPLTGFSYQTQTIDGYQIDQSIAPLAIKLNANIPIQDSAQQASVTVVPTSINFQSTLTLSYSNLMPIAIGANMKIKIPIDFNISANPLTVTTQGGNQNPTPTWSLNLTTQILTITGVNTVYLEQFDFIFITIAGVINPSQTARTQSFQIAVYDSSNLMIEYVNQGVYFYATTGGFASLTVTATNPVINAQNVGFTFTMVPENSFNSTACVQLLFPTELPVIQGAYIDNVSANMVSGNTVVNYGQQVIITNSFPNGYNKGDTIKFTLVGVTNPPTTQVTHSITVLIYYQNTTSMIANYTGSSLTFQAVPSNDLTLYVILDQTLTGQVCQHFQITGVTGLLSPPGSQTSPIQQGSQLTVFIPLQFIINDPVRVAASCTAVSGFSDEITCQFQAVVPGTGYTLWVYNGFDSQDFPGGNFTFYISGVQNPYSSQQTDSFQMSVLDQYGNAEYVYNQSLLQHVNPSSFAFAQVVSSSPQNGVSSMLNFSITLGVNTPAGSILNFVMPSDLQWDTSQPFTCNGSMNIQGGLQCYKRNGVSLNVVMMPNNTNRQPTFVNGTTIYISLGYIFNPISLAVSGTWQISTFQTSNNGVQYYYYNQITSGLTIQNTLKGVTTVLNITQYNNSVDLSQPTQILLKLQTQNIIPVGSRLAVTIPNNFVIGKSGLVLVNGVQVQSIFQQDQYAFSIPINAANNTFNIFIGKGLTNPKTGPYNYNQFSFFFSINNYGIDSGIDYQDWISVGCKANCATCSGNLFNCTSCGTDQVTGIASYKTGNLCVTQCPNGYYNGAGYQCLPCQSPCINCNIGPGLCTKCDPIFGAPYASLDTLQCYSTCPLGTYLDTTKGLCVMCQSPCSTCLSATQCLSCDRTNPNNTYINFFGLDDQCYESCPDISVPSPSKTCVECTLPCTTCTQLPDMCTNCTKGLYLYKQQCVKKCPFGYYSDELLNKCDGIASLDIPFPFTCLAVLFSILIGLSHFLKGSGPDQQGTSFFTTTLAFVDMLLRVNWIVLAILGYTNSFLVTFCGSIGLIVVCFFLNLAVWRRFFKFKYNMDDNDASFVAYSDHYKKTAKVLLMLSYVVSFQAIRLTYSKFLGKKQFMAKFSRQRRYYRLIGQCSMLEIFFVYLPAIAIYGYEMSQYKQGDQLFYIGLDSLILVVYATVLISVVVSQRESVLHPETLFEWKELLRCNVDSDPEVMYFDDVKNTENLTSQNNHQPTDSIDNGEQEVQSAADFNEMKKARQHLYQTEKRVQKVTTKTGNAVGLQRNQAQSSLVPGVSMVDYNQYRLLEEKMNRVSLKKALYENKRMQDYQEVQKLSSQMTQEKHKNTELDQRINLLRKQLSNLKQEIEKVEMQRNEEVSNTEQRKRKEIQKRSTRSELQGTKSPQSRKSNNTNSPQSQNKKSPVRALSSQQSNLRGGKINSTLSPSEKRESPKISPDRSANRNLRSRSPEINKRSPRPKKKKKVQEK